MKGGQAAVGETIEVGRCNSLGAREMGFNSSTIVIISTTTMKCLTIRVSAGFTTTVSLRLS
eukprot:468492-Amphidinium_carterae.1